MNKDTEPLDTSDIPKCPDCGYILPLANDGDDGDYYCMECSTLYDKDEVSP